MLQTPVNKVLSDDQLNSAALFPTLGGAPTAAPKGSWAQLRTRLSPPKESENSFAVLAEEQVTTPKAMSYGSMIKERIQKDIQEKKEADLAQQEVEDPLEMTDEQLTYEGWAILRISKAAGKGGYAIEDFGASAPSTEDKEDEYFRNGTTWDRMDHLLTAMNEFTTPEAFFKQVLSSEKVAMQKQEPQANPQDSSSRPDFLEPLVVGAPIAKCPTYIPPTPMFELIQKKKRSLRLARRNVA